MATCAMSQAQQLPAEPHVELVRCQTKYLGYAAPSAVCDGLEAVQRPLMEVMRASGGASCIFAPPFDTSLTAYTSGVALEAPAQAGSCRGELNSWWPISDLEECGAFRWDGTRFQPIRYESTGCGSDRPTLFAMTFRRREMPISDCWVFVTRTEQAAIALVAAIKMAHMNRSGWASTPADQPPCCASAQVAAPAVCQTQCAAEATTTTTSGFVGGSSMFQASGGHFQGGGGGGFSSWNAMSDYGGGGTFVNSCLGNVGSVYNDFYEKPPLRGYFYTPSSSLIQTFSVASLQQETCATPCVPCVPCVPCQPRVENKQQKCKVPLVSAAPRGIHGPLRPDYRQLDNYYGETNPDVITPTSWPLVHEAPPQPTAQQLPATQPIPGQVWYHEDIYPDYYPGFPDPIIEMEAQRPTVEVIRKVVRKKHRKQDYSDDEDDDDSSVSSASTFSTVSSNGRHGGRKYVLVREEELRQPRRADPASELQRQLDAMHLPPDDYLRTQPDHYPQYESHIAAAYSRHHRHIPGGAGANDYIIGQQYPAADPYADEGPYERRLPTGPARGAGKMMMAGDPAYDPDMMYGSNFILRPTQPQYKVGRAVD